MASLSTSIIDFYKDVVENRGDPHFKGWLLMSSPFPTLWIVLVYLLFVTKIGPKFMENRKPFKLTNIVLYYNAIQMFISAYLFYHICFTIGWLTDMQWFCQLPDSTMNPRTYAVLSTCWYCYISKLVELLDTVFFVLRKKNKQISHLHLVHHSVVPLIVWFGVKFVPGGSISFWALLNSFIHLVMYGYYLLAALGPHMQKYLWWKKYLTMMQIGQFILIIAHTGAHLFIKDCAVPKILVSAIISFTVLILLLFMHFYRMEYNARASQQQEKETNKRK